MKNLVFVMAYKRKGKKAKAGNNASANKEVVQNKGSSNAGNNEQGSLNNNNMSGSIVDDSLIGQGIVIVNGHPVKRSARIRKMAEKSPKSPASSEDGDNLHLSDTEVFQREDITNERDRSLQRRFPTPPPRQVGAQNTEQQKNGEGSGGKKTGDDVSDNSGNNKESNGNLKEHDSAKVDGNGGGDEDSALRPLWMPPKGRVFFPDLPEDIRLQWESVWDEKDSNVTLEYHLMELGQTETQEFFGWACKFPIAFSELCALLRQSNLLAKPVERMDHELFLRWQDLVQDQQEQGSQVKPARRVKP